jgi:hypothetical protein
MINSTAQHRWTMYGRAATPHIRALLLPQFALPKTAVHATTSTLAQDSKLIIVQQLAVSELGTQ